MNVKQLRSSDEKYLNYISDLLVRYVRLLGHFSITEILKIINFLAIFDYLSIRDYHS